MPGVTHFAMQNRVAQVMGAQVTQITMADVFAARLSQESQINLDKQFLHILFFK